MPNCNVLCWEWIFLINSLFIIFLLIILLIIVFLEITVSILGTIDAVFIVVVRLFDVVCHVQFSFKDTFSQVKKLFERQII